MEMEMEMEIEFLQLKPQRAPFLEKNKMLSSVSNGKGFNVFFFFFFFQKWQEEKHMPSTVLLLFFVCWNSI